jgi:hypothetical protein
MSAIVQWQDRDGCFYAWRMATVDNRRSRVLARIRRFGIPCDESTLVITKMG